MGQYDVMLGTWTGDTAIGNWRCNAFLRVMTSFKNAHLHATEYSWLSWLSRRTNHRLDFFLATIRPRVREHLVPIPQRRWLRLDLSVVRRPTVRSVG